MYELRQKQYSAFSNEISDSTKKLRNHLPWQVRELKNKDISFLKSGYLFVAHGLAELQISYISLQFHLSPSFPRTKKEKDLIHIEYSNQQQ